MMCMHGRFQSECPWCWKKEQFDVCSSCLTKFTDEGNRTHIQESGMCFGCEHVLGDILSSRADEQLDQEVI